jgi:intracellular sulfur oxidation DsrE/DsrF family protein
MKASLFLLFSLLVILAGAQTPQDHLALKVHHKVVIEVSVSGSIAYGTILNNAENLEKAFGPGNLQLELVCHGNGLDMLLPGSPKLAARIKALQKMSAVFAACSNTMKGRHIVLSELVPGAVGVDSGVAEVVRKEEDGWAYLKGG